MWISIIMLQNWRRFIRAKSAPFAECPQSVECGRWLPLLNANSRDRYRNIASNGQLTKKSVIVSCAAVGWVVSPSVANWTAPYADPVPS